MLAKAGDRCKIPGWYFGATRQGHNRYLGFIGAPENGYNSL
jgi:hypothetical protein